MSSTTSPVEIHIPAAAIYASLTGIRQDLRFVVEACRRLESLEPVSPEDVQVAEALTIAAVTRYGRCFVEGARRMIPEAVLGQLRPDQREEHEDFLYLRHRHVAHSVNPFEENRLVAWVSDRSEETEIQSVSVHHSRILTLSSPAAARLRGIAEALIDAVDDFAKLEQQKVLALARRLPYAEVRDQGMLTPFEPTWEQVRKRRRRDA
jgi:hypothetical protein